MFQFHPQPVPMFPSYGRIRFRSVPLPHFVIQATVHGHLSCFYFRSIMNNAASEYWCTGFCVEMFFISLDYMPRIGLPGSGN